jgi:hypothetical protein
MPEYKSREFCRDIECIMQVGIDEGIAVDLSKKYCHEYCKAYLFHKWLQENNYEIVKGDGGENYE